MLEVKKTEATVNASLDMLAMVKAVAQSILNDIPSCFYTNGTLHETNAERNLLSIKARAQTLISLVDNVK